MQTARLLPGMGPKHSVLLLGLDLHGVLEFEHRVGGVVAPESKRVSEGK